MNKKPKPMNTTLVTCLFVILVDREQEHQPKIFSSKISLNSLTKRLNEIQGCSFCPTISRRSITQRNMRSCAKSVQKIYCFLLQNFNSLDLVFTLTKDSIHTGKLLRNPIKTKKLNGFRWSMVFHTRKRDFGSTVTCMTMEAIIMAKC